MSLSDLLNPLESVPLGILAAEIAATITLSRRRINRRLLFVIGSYLLCVAAALAFGLIVHDEFGYGFIPLLVLTVPWQLLHIRLPQSAFATDIAQMAFGLAFNCALFYLIGRLSYPKHATTLSGRHAT